MGVYPKMDGFLFGKIPSFEMDDDDYRGTAIDGNSHFRTPPYAAVWGGDGCEFSKRENGM